ncbi:MAG: EAL domain-containing protein [Thermodesulfovibrio sp.]|nr:EAL domain-containing protein [Thermodesulfovibrio sp.]
MKEEILSLALCPHIKKGELNNWKKIASKISKILNKKIKIITSKNFGDEQNSEEKYHIIYANPDLTIKLINMGYLPVFKIKNENPSICSITSQSYSPQKKLIRVALVKQKYFFLPLLLHKREYKKFKLIFVKNYDEVINCIKKNKADIGFVYTSSFEKLELDRDIKFSEDYCFPMSHFVLIHPSIKKFIKNLVSIEELQDVSKTEIDNLIMLYKQLDILLQDWAYHDISEAIMSLQNLGIIIYHEKILFSNKYARDMLGYSEEELNNMESTEIIYPEDRPKAIKNKERRLRGEKFSQIYDIRFQKKDGSIIFVQCITNTILFRGLYCGFVIFYDVTSKKYAEKIKDILIQTNKLITKSITEEEIYCGICKTLVDTLKLQFAWIGKIDENTKRIIPKYQYGEAIEISSIYDLNLLEEKTLLKGDILIKEDLRSYVKKQANISKLIDKGFMSSCTIPLKKFGKIAYLLEIYSNIPYFFNESTIDILEEIQYDLSFALERIERIRHNTFISEAIKNSDTWILITDEFGNILYVNEAVEKISGYSKEELIGNNPRIFKSGLNPPEFYENMWNTILSGKIFNAITPNRKKDGEIFHVDLKIIPVKLPGEILRFVAVAKDITERIKLTESIQKLQNFDALTGLLNMNAFAGNVSQKLKENDKLGLMILIDIYEMTNLNKIYGIHLGDRVLIEFAKKIKESFDETDIIARIGADTFGVYMTIENRDDIYKAYSKLYQLNNITITLDDKTVLISINGAIAIFPKDGRDFKTLYERADITLQRAKKAGAGFIQFFDTEIEKQAEKLWEIFNLIKRAYEEKLFKFYYQPYFHTDTLKVAGFEALVRIIDIDGTVYNPGVFIDYLENSQYLSKFEIWAIGETIEKIKKWDKNISLNISGKTFSNPILLTILSSIPSDIRDRITIEITERVFMSNTEYTLQMLNDIKAMDNPPKIAVDDFGTGYSSILYLKDLPIDVIKIDRAFIKDMLTDKKSLAIVQLIVDLAKRLDKITLAEGVETEQQLKLLKSIGCHLVQGFLFSKPLPEDNLAQYII